MKNIFSSIIVLLGILFSQTSEQTTQVVEKAKIKGMSKDQIIKAGQERGYDEKQINDAIQGYKASETAIDQSTEVSRDSNVNDFYESGQESSSLDTKEPVSIEDDLEVIDDPGKDFESKSQSTQSTPSYFGYDIFSRDPALFQAASVGVVDPDYLIGPGDEIIIMLWGETQFRQVFTVDREGFVFIPEIGQVFVNGLNLNLLESKLFRVFSQSYASLNPQGRTPTTFLDVSLGNLRPLRIQVLGEVAQPGAYTVSPSATLFSALYYFNGPTTLGSLRDIQLIRGGKKVVSIDFYDYLLTGKKPKDQKLQLDDVIFIPRRLKTVTIKGEINRAGIYELKSNEHLADLIKIAGDLPITAYMNRAQIDRIVPFQDRAQLGMDRMYKDVSLEEVLDSDNDFLLQDGDNINIFSVLDLRRNVVDIRGAVTRPGSYELVTSLTISELINKADGLLGDAYLERVDVVRMNQDFSEELIKLNLKQALERDIENDIFLQGLDRVRVYGVTEMVSNNYVSIVGHVKRPGRFLLQENLTLYDLIFKAGGFLDEEYKNRTYLERGDLIRLNNDGITAEIKKFNLGKVLESPESSENFNLQPDDIIRIYEKDIFIYNKYISINGVVRRPGKYKLKENMSLKDLILESGGFSDNTYRYKVEVARVDPFNNNIEKFSEIVIMAMDNNMFLSDYETKGDLLGSDNYYLKPYDLISIRRDPYFRFQKKLEITGEVMYPGSYAILNSSEQVTDIIQRAGGLTYNAYPDASEYIRDNKMIKIPLGKILKNPNSKRNFVVQDGDKINIVPYSNLVTIVGEVNSPGVRKFMPGKRLRYYIKQSGGLSPNAENKNIWIEYPDGDSKRYKHWSLISNKVSDGAVIIIGKKEEQEPFDYTDYAKELTSIIANFAQVVSIIFLAMR